jgi:putative acetyltransferase
MLTLKIIKEEGMELDRIRELFSAYEAELNEDLCFQSFNEELKNPLNKYARPGLIILALWNNEPAGCVALQSLKENEVCEMKRLYVRPQYRQYGIGRQLVEQLLLMAKENGFSSMKLDTLQKLQAAIQLYIKYGFIETKPYYHNPLPGVVYMEKLL